MAPTAPTVPAALERIARLVEAVSGIVFLPAGARAFDVAVRRRALASGFADDLDAYAIALARQPAGAAEMQALLERLVVRETRLFRQPAQMMALEQRLLPALHECLPPGMPLRLWSAGTATGEEAYSAAAVALRAVGTTRPVEVLGTDLSQEALARAEQARYPVRALASAPAALSQGAFVAVAGGWVEPAPRVRAAVRFAEHNLAADPFRAPGDGGPFHVILCRNVLIYFRPSTVARVLKGLHAGLADDGYLLPGHAEALVDAPFEPLLLPHAYAYRKRPPAPDAVPSAPPGRATASGSRGASVEDLLASAYRLVEGDAVEAALDMAQQAASRAPADARPYALQGLLASRLGQADVARAALERATSLAPSDPVAWLHLAAVQRATGDLAAARASYRRAATLLASLPPTQLVDEYAAGHLARLAAEQARPLDVEPRAD